jgi:hypothetical protein
MKKILIALVLLVVAAVAAGPFLIGSQIEKITKNLVEKGNKQLATLVESNPQFQSASVTLDSYEKGYLNANANGVLKLSLVGADSSEGLSIPYTTEITHGPYLGDAGFGLAKIITRPDLTGFDLPEAINADTVIIEGIVDFNQGITETLTVAPIKHVAEDGNTVDFAGAKINSKSHVKNRLTFTADMNVEQLKVTESDQSNVITLKPFKMDISGKGDGNMQAGSYEAISSAIEANMGEGISVVLQKMDFAGKYKQADGASFMLGDGTMSMKDLVITNPSALPMPLKIPELKFETKLEQAQNKDLTMSVNYQGTLDPSMMKVMNSPVDVKTAEIDLQFKSIPLAAVTDYQKLAKELSKEADPQKAAAAMQAKMFELVQMLAQNAASTQIKVNATSDEGDLIADIDTGFKPGIDFDAARMMQILAAPDPSSIMPLLVGRGNVSLSKGVTDQAGLTPMIQMMAADFVTLKEDKFVSELQITDGQLLINGMPLPLAAQ